LAGVGRIDDNIMLQPTVFLDSDKTYHILCLGAHCDDIEIGCGGALLDILKHNNNIHVTWVVFTSNEKRRLEAEAGAKLFLDGAASSDVRIFDLRDGFLPYAGERVKELCEDIKKTIDVPDIVFTHARHDRHQDHRFISELTWNTFRNHLVLEYEIPKWDGDMGVPNTFIELSEETARKKIEFLQRVYNTQQEKKWFTDDLFWSLMRIRGMESGAVSRLAEAFYSRKIVLSSRGVNKTA